MRSPHFLLFLETHILCKVCNIQNFKCDLTAILQLCVIGNLGPETVDEAKALTPSLEVRGCLLV